MDYNNQRDGSVTWWLALLPYSKNGMGSIWPWKPLCVLNPVTPNSETSG